MLKTSQYKNDDIITERKYIIHSCNPEDTVKLILFVTEKLALYSQLYLFKANIHNLSINHKHCGIYQHKTKSLMAKALEILIEMTI